jgi:hypothetical protein
MRPRRLGAKQVGLRACGRVAGESRADEADRRAVHQVPVLRDKEGRRAARSQPEACPAAHASDGPRGHTPQAIDQPPGPRPAAHLPRCTQRADATRVFVLASPSRQPQNERTSRGTQPVYRLVAARGPWSGSRGPPPRDAPFSTRPPTVQQMGSTSFREKPGTGLSPIILLSVCSCRGRCRRSSGAADVAYVAQSLQSVSAWSSTVCTAASWRSGG